MSEERVYKFTVNFGNEPIIVETKESNLSENQKDLLVGELIRQHHSMPADVQAKFLTYLLAKQKLDGEGN